MPENTKQTVHSTQLYEQPAIKAQAYLNGMVKALWTLPHLKRE